MQETLKAQGLHVDVCPPQSIVPHDVVLALVQNSRQEHIRATTPDDETVRFTDAKAFGAWFEQGKFLVSLVASETNALAGVAWFSTQRNVHAPGATHAYAHRLYKGFVGKGLSIPFAQEAHALAGAYIGRGPFWLSVMRTNTAALRTYEKVGYVPVIDVGNRRIMVRDEGAM
jgi:RimJ/RimL family protein N-acetyltransferase